MCGYYYGWRSERSWTLEVSLCLSARRCAHLGRRQPERQVCRLQGLLYHDRLQL